MQNLAFQSPQNRHNMKFFVLCFFAVIAVALAQDTYTSRFDHVDIDQILQSERLFQNYYKCLSDEGKCTPDASELKRLLPDALSTNCSKCTDKQRKGAEKVLRYMIENKKTEFDTLSKKYDPENVYLKKYNAELEKLKASKA